MTSPTDLIPRHALIVCGPFAPGLSAAQALAAIARGLRAGGAPEPDSCALPTLGGSAEEVRALLEEVDFDARMRSARAVIVGASRLQERALAGSVTFEIATRARQGGVPAYAVTSENELDAFDARILDLQVILEASTPRALSAAGERLAALV